jgi:hypothetical protein
MRFVVMTSKSRSTKDFEGERIFVRTECPSTDVIVVTISVEGQSELFVVVDVEELEAILDGSSKNSA